MAPSFTFDTCSDQDFTMPPSVIDYLIRSPSDPGFWETLIKTCKYMFDRRPIVVVNDITHHKNGEIVLVKNLMKMKLLDRFVFKFWVTDGLVMFNEDFPNVFNGLIFKSDVTYLHLCNIAIDLRNLEWLGSRTEIFISSKSGIFENDGNVALLERVLSVMPHLRDVTYSAHTSIGKDTVRNLIARASTGKFSNIALYQLDEKFDFPAYAAFMKKNPAIRFVVAFIRTISDPYKRILEDFVKYLEKAVYGPQRPRIFLEIPYLENDEYYYQQYDTMEDYDDSDSDYVPDSDMDTNSDDY